MVDSNDSKNKDFFRLLYSLFFLGTHLYEIISEAGQSRATNLAF